jgi:hypothetical protein
MRLIADSWPLWNRNGRINRLYEQGWDFVLAQASNTSYRPSGSSTWTLVGDLPVSKRQPVYLEQVEWTEPHRYGPLNILAFYKPHQAAVTSQGREICSCATSLPIAHTLRQIGRRRWGIEGCFKDFKSNGWNLELSDLKDFGRRNSLLIRLSLAYTWATCVGRWLCKTGQRSLIDSHPARQFSLFHLGWDWLVHQYRLGASWPLISTLYS